MQLKIILYLLEKESVVPKKVGVHIKLLSIT